MWNLPNILTMSRIVVIPVLVASFFMEQPLGSHVAFVTFALAGITDFFDGYLARATGSVSKIGQFLDPIADKLMVGAVIIMLVFAGWVDGIHVVAAVIIMCRELLVSGLREFLAGIQVSVPVTMLAKWKTTVQMLALGSLTWSKGAIAFGIPAQEIGIVALWIAAVLTLYTGLDYLRVGLKHMV
ncbi:MULTISPECIES: CDP-diacylglycerol--glycerol-3-phosphate 3-phosphatidyltransferase [Kordiimonas]|uniref:CDP-diacylglycerol--glycerol-3-phosphate 3-phosphatidyltransferase n=1 Tax=Kordiimonas TaxID=288021 RepID=UPI0021071CD9|nr:MULTISPECIES: CDP-diacylglycerol--glycerol-3-phosphate 3-phosphatidyltransferase [Kordiimonas]UTW58010.1 CDP-diacylglycerol--glycerol-3-phosphate 3-phosphatidyltransferase [Kordiimonas sp. SCSIO 12603]